MPVPEGIVGSAETSLNSYGRWRQLLLPYVTVPPPTTQPQVCVPGTALVLSFRRNVLRWRDGSLSKRSSSLKLRFSHSSLLYSCSRPYFPQPPCSRTTTEKPATDNFLAMMPPPAPEPMMTKSTSVDVGNCLI